MRLHEIEVIVVKLLKEISSSIPWKFRPPFRGNFVIHSVERSHKTADEVLLTYFTVGSVPDSCLSEILQSVTLGHSTYTYAVQIWRLEQTFGLLVFIFRNLKWTQYYFCEFLLLEIFEILTISLGIPTAKMVNLRGKFF